MKDGYKPGITVTGIGVTSSIGQGQRAFAEALLKGEQRFSVLVRPGRSFADQRFIGAEIGVIDYPISENGLKGVSLSGKIALATLAEAWEDAALEHQDPTRIGLVVAGSNFQQREIHLIQERHKKSPFFLSPRYAVTFMDSDICGICSEHFGIRGFTCTVGGSSASGQMAIIQAIQNIQAGLVDHCVVLAPMMDLSFWELQSFRSVGAMGSDRFADFPEQASRPFDQDRDGFIFGESCGAVVLERASENLVNSNMTKKSYGAIAGWGVAIDGNRNPNASLSGEVAAIHKALFSANLKPTEIDYVNPHGSGSVQGDEIEVAALSECSLSHAHINTTKSILGHGLSAAGLVEFIATLLQIKNARLHPSRNLENFINDQFNWVAKTSVEAKINTALTVSIGFGGVNTALCVRADNV